MKPRLEACYFGSGEQGCKYTRLARVLEYGAGIHCKDWQVNIARLEPPDYTSACGNQSHVWNTQKLEHWVRQVLEAQDGEQILLIDGDIMLLRPLDDVWAAPFDLAYTIRHGHGLPLNGGLVFVRVSDRVRAFMKTWWKTNVRFLGNAAEHGPWRQRYAGINQASFGYMLEQVRHGLDLAKLPCWEWNCCEWERYVHEKTRCVHIKSGLRRQLFRERPSAFSPAPKLRTAGASLIRTRRAMTDYLIDVWNRQEAAVLRAKGIQNGQA